MNWKRSLLTFALLDTVSALQGITMNMYPPDPCGSICFKYFKGFILDCSVILTDEELAMAKPKSSHDKPTKVNNSVSCLSNNEHYLNSVAWCFETQCSNFSDVSLAEVNRVWSKSYPVSNYSFVDALAMGKPTEVANMNLNPNMTYGLLVNETEFYISYKSADGIFLAENTQAKMALSLVMITWSLVLFGMFYNISEKFHLGERLLPRSFFIFLRKNIIYPALFREKCAVPISLGEGLPIDYAPPRIVSLTILLYYAINLIFCAVPYNYFNLFNRYPHDRFSVLCLYVGNRTGFLAFANMPVLVLFASRNNIFQWLTGWSYATFQHYHRHVAIICLLETIAHSVIYTATYARLHIYSIEAAKPYFWWGIISTIVGSLIPIFSILKLRISRYEFFLAIHYVMAILFLVTAHLHLLKKTGSKWGYPDWLYLSYALWFFDLFMRTLRILRLKFQGCRSKALVELVDKESRTIKITYDVGNAKQNYLSNYYYLYFFTVAPFFTSHPFTAAEWSSQNDVEEISDSSDESEKLVARETTFSNSSKLSFYVKCMKGTTNEIFRKLEKNNYNPLEIYSLLEGPYGSYERDMYDDFDFVMILTGGIGNTIVLNHLRYFLDYRSTKSIQSNSSVKIQVLHVDRFSQRLAYLKEKIQSLITLNVSHDVKVDLHNTSHQGHVNIREYLKKYIEHIETEYPTGIRRVAVISCGPAKFNDVSRHACVELQKKIVDNTIVTYISDPFEW